MSKRDFVRYLQTRPKFVPDSEQKRKLIVISDSKGFSLEKYRETDTEKNIYFNSHPGRTTYQAANIVHRNIENYIERYGDITLGIWTFTCDFTDKPGQNIVLNQTTIDQIITECNRIQSICDSYGNRVKVVFLECPYYSISIWNQTKCGSLREQFIQQDKILEDKIDELNLRLQYLNEQNGISAPRFSLDLKKSRKSNKVYKTGKISFGCLKDGVHPCDELSGYWLVRLVEGIVAKHCFA